jgi:hypothetical protein
MHSRFRSKGVLLATLVAVVAGLLATPRAGAALPRPGAKKQGFRLFAKAIGALAVNRVYCGLDARARICVDSLGSSTIGGGFWPKGTADQYVFQSGLQAAGIIDASGGPWANDTAASFFMDATGFYYSGEAIRQVYNATDPSDLANWPTEACVPNGDAEADLFNDLLRTDPSNASNPACRKSASQGDIWFLTWDGNPTLGVGARQHPLGIAVETRGMGWNFPTGNEDVLYFIYTFYNITSTNKADYAAIREPLQDILYQKGLDFHSVNNAQFGIVLPPGGYTINNLYAAFAADMDVGEATANYSSVNLPFAMGYVYENTFSQPPGWTFNPGIFQSPFFAGVGFVGVKYLRSPTGAGAIQLFSNTVRQPPFPAVDDPATDRQLYRYLSGTLSPALGDLASCNTGNPLVTHICFVNNTEPFDMRFYESSTPLSLGPGQSGSIVVAYIFAPPVKIGSCAGLNCDVKPGNPLFLNNTVQLATLGTNPIDSLTGYVGYSDLNHDGVATQDEFDVVPGSLLGKAKVAQSVFDNGFLLPFAPDPPDFFLIPGDNQVTVLWRPSASETTGDPFFAIASASTISGAANALYDPNYRQKDVEGYRVYRGRVDSPNELQLLAQFDFQGTTIADYTGQVNPSAGCAPEIGVTAGCLNGETTNKRDGTALTNHGTYPLAGDVVQVKTGDRLALATGTIDTVIASIDNTVSPPDTTFTTIFIPNKALITKADTIHGLEDTGVPYVYVDKSPKNNFRYFYSVVAFDVNSIESGPTSLESQRRTKAVIPVAPAPNGIQTSALTVHVIGRGVAMDTVIKSDPTLDPNTGMFSGPARPANGLVSTFVGQLAGQVVGGSGKIVARLDSIHAGQADQSLCCGAVGTPIASTHFIKIVSPIDSFDFVVPLTVNGNDALPVGTGTLYKAIRVDSSLAAKYDKTLLQSFHLLPDSGGFALGAQTTDSLPSLMYAGDNGLGCRILAGVTGANYGDDATKCIYNGPRWFDGPSPTKNETQADPNTGNCPFPNGNDPTCAVVEFNNAGALTGVKTIHMPAGYFQLQRRWRNVTQVLGTVFRAADFNVYWGTAGKIDSVIDVSDNLKVPFSPNIGPSWGVLNASAALPNFSSDGRPGALTANDIACVAPMTSFDGPPQFYPCTGNYTLDSVATLDTVAFYKDAPAAAATAPASGQGFMLYIAGTVSMFAMSGASPALPSSGTVWTLRTYSGSIVGGKGVGGGNTGLKYSFSPAIRPFNLPGASVSIDFSVVNQIRGVTGTDLSKVHTVPDPYYVTNAFEQTTDNKVIKFVNLPSKAIIRIYSASGILVTILEHNSNIFGGEEDWNVRNRNNQVVASGVYFYHIESNDGGKTARRIGRFTIVNFAQ